MKMIFSGARRYFLYFFLCFLFCCSGIIHLGALNALASEDLKTVRVGYTDFKGFIDREGDTYTGYAVDYLNEIAKYAPVRYEYVYGTWKESLDRLRNKEIDLICSAKYTLERDHDFDFTMLPIGIDHGLLYTLPGKDIFYEDFTAINGKKIAFLERALNADSFSAYAQKHQFSFVLRTFQDEDSMRLALVNGEVDALATSHMAFYSDLKLIAHFGAEPFYLMSYEGNPLVSDMNEALEKIERSKPAFELSLFQKHYGQSAVRTQPAFTREESAFISQSGTIEVGFVPHRAPLFALNTQTGATEGILASLTEEIGTISGLHFVFKPVKPGQSITSALQHGAFALASGVPSTERTDSMAHFVLTEPFFYSEASLVVQKGASFLPGTPLKVAITEAQAAFAASIQKSFPEFSLLFLNTTEECFQAVQEGRTDALMQNTYILHRFLQNPRYVDFKILPFAFTRQSFRMVLPENADPRLLSILNKSIAVLSREKTNQSILANTLAKPYQATLADLAQRYADVLLIIGGLATLCLVLLGSNFYLRQQNLQRLRCKNEQLRESMERAESASKAKSQFLSRMSHEIRTPMNAIFGLTSIARQSLGDPGRCAECLSKIMDSSKILLGIINDVLDMSSIESGKMKIAKEPFDLRQLLSGIVSLYYPQCTQKKIKFEAVLSGVTEERLIGDALRVNQILLNLLSNALKFTDSGGEIKLTVTQKLTQANTVFMQFRVSDNGCGMSDELKTRVFSPFEQESAATAEKHGGSGLGLSIAKNLVELMQGAISVTSQKGQGTTFTIDLPFTMNPAEVNVKGPSLGELRVLVVDDDADTLAYISIILQRIGVAFDCVGSGEEALQALEAKRMTGQKYDVCLVDWKMPHMDGVALTQKIRDGLHNETLVVIVSAYDIHEVETKALAAGANLLVTKPVFQSTLFNLLMELSGGVYVTQNAKEKAFDLQGYRILLAEDNLVNIEVAKALLAMVGLEVDCAQTGKQAVDMFENAAPGTYDLILMDVQMPEMDGYEATGLIRASTHPQAGSIPILAMTANAFTEDVTMALSKGMNGHIAKPIETEVLYSTLQAFLGK